MLANTEAIRQRLDPPPVASRPGRWSLIWYCLHIESGVRIVLGLTGCDILHRGRGENSEFGSTRYTKGAECSLNGWNGYRATHAL